MAPAQNATQTMSIGGRLKEARRKKGFSLDDVRSRLRIHRDILERMERDEFRGMPGGMVYTKGFLKQYAQFLELNGSEIISEFESLGLQKPNIELMIGSRPKPADPAEKERKRRETRHTLRKLRRLRGELRRRLLPVLPHILGALLVLWALFSLVGWVQSVMKDNPQTERPQRPAPTVQTPAGRTLPQAKPAAVKPAAAQPAPAPAQPPEPKNYLNSPASGNYPVIRDRDPMNLQVKATKDVWLRVSADGKVEFESILKIGDNRSWRAEQNFELKLGRPEGTNLVLNGYLIGKPRGGQAKNVRLTRQGMEEI